MKVNLVDTVTINGQLLLAENMETVSTPPQVMGVFVQQAMEAGNIIMGHTTYQMIMQTPAMQQAFSGIKKVLVSKNTIEQPDCKTVSSPLEAVEYLTGEGYQTAILAGGLQTYNSFLREDLVTDLYLSIVPVVIGNGGILATPNDTLLSFKLAGQTMLADDVIQLHYTKDTDK